jgi:hypothetical protein
VRHDLGYEASLGMMAICVILFTYASSGSFVLHSDGSDSNPGTKILVRLHSISINRVARESVLDALSLDCTR